MYKPLKNNTKSCKNTCYPHTCYLQELTQHLARTASLELTDHCLLESDPGSLQEEFLSNANRNGSGRLGSGRNWEFEAKHELSHALPLHVCRPYHTQRMVRHVLVLGSSRSPVGVFPPPAVGPQLVFSPAALACCECLNMVLCMSGIWRMRSCVIVVCCAQVFCARCLSLASA